MPGEISGAKRGKILVVSHKSYCFPEDALYVPIRVGCAFEHSTEGLLCDNTGENLSAKNNTFCELTALYWAWKNRFFDDAEYAGLVHYRRYFAGSFSFDGHQILSEIEIKQFLRNCDVIVPKKRRYYIETVYDHYTHAHNGKDLDIIREIIAVSVPEYLEAFDRTMQRRSLYLYNMFVMRTAWIYAYSEWLFPILFEAEKRIDTRRYDSYQQRLFGFLAERLFNVWLLKNGLRIHEVKVVNLEGENLLKKGLLMLKRKFFG